MEPATPISVAVGADNADSWLSRAVVCLQSGGIVSLPTETFYGLAADAGSAPAVRSVLSLKGYPGMRPVLILAGSAVRAEELCPWSHIPGAAELTRTFWPGPLTLILPLGPGRTLAACPGATAALRVPAHPVPRRLAQAFGGFLTGTSANRAGEPAARTAGQVRRSFPRGLDLVLDGGPTAGSEPSTLVDLTSAEPRLVRAGAVPWETIVALLGDRPSSSPGVSG